MDLRQTLTTEFEQRQRRSPRYSLRAFARDLGTDHATLSQLLRGRRVLSPRLVRQFGRRLHLTDADIADACEQHHADAILRLARLSTFRPNSRWIATRTGLPLDAVNAALAPSSTNASSSWSRPPSGNFPAPPMPNPVVRWQIISPEPDQAAGFYQKLFAWKLTQANALGYRELLCGSAAGIDGGVWPAPPGVKGFVQLFVEVPDLDACIAQATVLGAQVLIPKSVLPDGDAMAVLLDPAGISFAVCQTKPQP